MTWQDRDQGIRVLTVTCVCGRGVYLRPTAAQVGEPARCAGCGNRSDECWCPHVPRIEAIP